jgi:hypothetical protein
MALAATRLSASNEVMVAANPLSACKAAPHLRRASAPELSERLVVAAFGALARPAHPAERHLLFSLSVGSQQL